MRSQITIIRDCFRKVGLRTDNEETRNAGALTICKNASISPSGLIGYIPSITDITSTFGLTKRWPFPQLFLSDVGIHVGALEGLYFLNNNLSLFSYGTGAVTWPWTCAPVGSRPFFTSGNVLVYYDDAADAYKVVT
jgi:hypothetical protein